MAQPPSASSTTTWPSRPPHAKVNESRSQARTKLQVPVRGAGRGRPPGRDRTGPAGGGRLVAGRRLLAVRAVRGGRLHPRRGQPGGRAGAPGPPGPSPAPWPPGAIPTSSGHSPAGQLTVGRPIITNASVTKLGDPSRRAAAAAKPALLARR